MTIVNFYIECKDQAKLESLLQENGYAFYDATRFCRLLKACRILEEVEAILEDK